MKEKISSLIDHMGFTETVLSSNGEVHIKVGEWSLVQCKRTPKKIRKE